MLIAFRFYASQLRSRSFTMRRTNLNPAGGGRDVQPTWRVFDDSDSGDFLWAVESNSCASPSSQREVNFVPYAASSPDARADEGRPPDAAAAYSVHDDVDFADAAVCSDFELANDCSVELDLHDASSPDEWVDSVFRTPGQGCGDSSVYLLEVSEHFSVTLACPKFFIEPRVSGMEAVKHDLDRPTQHGSRRSVFFRVELHLLCFSDRPLLASTCTNPGCDCGDEDEIGRGRWGRWSRHLADPLTDVSCDRFDRLFRGGPVDDLLCGCARAAVKVLLTTETAGFGHMPALDLAGRFYDFVCESVPFGVFHSHAFIMPDSASNASSS
jgi:hypothetical protein